jgi:hypothetical protein
MTNYLQDAGAEETGPDENLQGAGTVIVKIYLDRYFAGCRNSGDASWRIACRT